MKKHSDECDDEEGNNCPKRRKQDEANDDGTGLKEYEGCSQDASSMDIKERVVTTAHNVAADNAYDDVAETANALVDVIKRMHDDIIKLLKMTRRNMQAALALEYEVTSTQKGSLEKIGRILNIARKNSDQLARTVKLIEKYKEVIHQNPPETNLINNEAIDFLIKYYGERVQKTTQMIQEFRSNMG